ncbi:MAG: hypothetical protein U5N58_00620 [Actinomycetota bacterium]|nr:hypothetical protein [Actinomycetota bacterium]
MTWQYSVPPFLALAQKVAHSLNHKQYKAKTLTLKLRFADFKTITRSITLSHYTSDIIEIHRASTAVLAKTDISKKR